MIPSGAPILTAVEMRHAEEAVFAGGVAQDELMERAGAAVARETARFAMGRPILILAGPGNNGGDAYVAARLLQAWGHDVNLVATGAPAPGAAERMHVRWQGPTSSLYAARSRPVVIDGLFGTGLTRPLERGLAAVFADLCKQAEFTLSIDLPSGIDTDTGADLGAPRGIDVTLALGALKPAHVLDAGLERCGRVLLADIGIPVEGSRRTVARPRLRAPDTNSHKYTRGLVAVVEGAMPGAARLAARAAMAGGAGYVVLAGDRPWGAGPDALVRREVRSAEDLTEFLDWDRIDAVVLGPGLGRDRRAEAYLRAAFAADKPLILDGDALSLLGSGAARWLETRAASTWVTPHSGEFDRMFAGGGASKIDRTLAAAAETGATILHKGADTVVANAKGQVRVLAGASPWLSTAGTGDVLAGLLAAQVAQGGKGLAPAEAAVWLHARAARLAGPALIADALVGHIPGAISECL
ncbi:bifunctional ADP-dependent NAD(P)H-hydrate dehydratase/NAD(P)H-hydrate epimerase [Sphingomonas sp. LM7]|uniref:bifunctional ADP-dependent NAD(P)H-hydrate dehydratase/NAD(P)H-hydrate epimerase n=1 Tax=Sphingomonas sp. LM7 TaxID=1938607 RepID=UPI0009839CA3|nr:bifunctional ADP-dependent NAD(P)H-hydrate dehydratase/NAD(P)H-hydrate epimerase [Sphingomonas sp. LM7]AQR72938.1 bifunctional ADP-dependent (S)-NAD(P)H-hydrate dehydratase/NAD(P)H-hydrate epimerase [Sphingomonas sp. LM7]